MIQIKCAKFCVLSLGVLWCAAVTFWIFCQSKVWSRVTALLSLHRIFHDWFAPNGFSCSYLSIVKAISIDGNAI